MKSQPRIIHCIAQCKDCDWTEDDYKSAARDAADHSRREGHVVRVEQGVVYTVTPAKSADAREDGV